MHKGGGGTAILARRRGCIRWSGGRPDREGEASSLRGHVGDHAFTIIGAYVTPNRSLTDTRAQTKCDTLRSQTLASVARATAAARHRGDRDRLRPRRRAPPLPPATPPLSRSTSCQAWPPTRGARRAARRDTRVCMLNHLLWRAKQFFGAGFSARRAVFRARAGKRAACRSTHHERRGQRRRDPGIPRARRRPRIVRTTTAVPERAPQRRRRAPRRPRRR